MKTRNKFPNPFETDVHKTERTAVSVLMHWMREIIEDNDIDLGLPDVETIGKNGKMPDIVIYESRRSQRVLCVIEAKQPHFDVFNETELKKPACEKANKRKAKYFATTNFKNLIWFNTEKVNANKPDEEQIIDKYDLSEIENIDNIEQTKYSEPIKNGLKVFLTKLFFVFSGKEPIPKLAIDDFLVFRLQEKIRILSAYYRLIIEDQCHKNTSFEKELKKWFKNQGWSFFWQQQDYDKVARQTAYLLVNKILFYNLLQSKRQHELDPLGIPESLTKSFLLQNFLQAYFNSVLAIDYEIIYTTDFIDNLAFSDAKEVVKEIKELINILKQYDFSKIGFDIIGSIFERLIPKKERHNLGQFFTRSDIVDLILRFCLQHEENKILDPSCGAGTFLVRAYYHKKFMNQRLEHENLLKDLWGIDIAKFPAHLSIINLAINDLSVEKNYPNIIQEDFFDISVGDEGFDPEKWRKRIAKTLRKKERDVTHPRWFDAIVGNPPYTRQEEITEISPEDSEYKENIIKRALDLNNKKIAEIGKRAGIYTYFFIHGTKLLKDGGYFGFIVLNSWLDVEYGKGLQEFFFNNYKIVAIIDSKVERWFEEADINTCIVILQKCKDEKERNNNLIRFVYLKKPLKYFIPSAQDMWEKQVERFNEIDKLKKTILAHSDFYENEDLRILPRNQKELWNEGFDYEENKYIGSKWGKYLRAPEIFFKILEKGKEKFIPLKEISKIRFGIKTGANEFFYLTEEQIKKKKIEKDFWMQKNKENKWIPNYIIKSPRECKTIIINPEDLKYRVLMIHKDKKDLRGKNILKYIKLGESKGFDKRPTCAGRGKMWYDLPEIKAPILSKRFVDVSYGYFYNPLNLFVGDTFFVIDPKNKSNTYPICIFLNSTLGSFFTEIYGRTSMGEGVLLVYGPEIVPMPILKVQYISSKIKKIKQYVRNSEICSIFKELGASSPGEISLDKIDQNRREIDKIIMGEILGLTDEEQLEVYRAIVDLVKSRIERAKSVSNKKKTKEGINVDAFISTVMEKIGDVTLGKFYKEKILSQKQLLTKGLPKVSKEITIKKDLFGWILLSGKNHIECSSEEEARYLKIFIEAGLDKAKIPKDENYLNKILYELEDLKAKIDEDIDYYLDSIVDTKTKDRLRHLIWLEITK